MKKRADNVHPIQGAASDYFANCTPAQVVWLSTYAQHNDYQASTDEAGVDEWEVASWHDTDENFQNQFERARRIAGLRLEGRALRKAESEEGSDRLILALLEQLLPERYDKDYAPVEDDDEGSFGFTKTEVRVDPTQTSDAG